MLDTLKLMLNDYEITSQSSLKVQPGAYEVGTGEKLEYALFKNSSGVVHYGSKAYLNEKNWNLTLKPLPGGFRASGAFLQFSVPKNHYGNNYYSTGEQGTQAVFKKIEKELREHGVLTDLEKAELSRVDTVKDIKPEEPFENYSGLFKLLNAKRTQKREYGTTFLLSNTQQEFCIYDKLAEMRMRHEETSEFPETMRFEHRALNKQKVSSLYGFSQAQELFHGGYAVIKEKQRENWLNSLFCFSVEKVMLLGSRQLEEEMKLFKEKHSRNWFQNFLRAYGAYHLAEVAGVEIVKLALENMESDRMKVWRTIQLLEEAKREIELVKQAENSRKTLGELYEELKEKVCLN